MYILFLASNTLLSTTGAYLVFKRFRHLGLLAAGVLLVVSTAWSMHNEQWWPMLAGLAAATLGHRLIGDPLDT